MTCHPVILFYGIPAGIRYTLEAAVKAFPDLVVLTDTMPATGRIRHYTEYECPDTDYFREHYRHYSTNGPEFERFCFVRWFYLRNYLRSRGGGFVLHFDADVYMCADGPAIKDSFESCEFCIQDISGHTSKMSLAALEDLCVFLLDFVKEGYRRHLPMVEAMRAEKRTGGICDLTALTDFYHTYPGTKCNRNPLVSTNINDEPGYRKNRETGVVDMFMRQGNVYLYQEEEGRYDRFLTLHFQGERGKSPSGPV